MKTKVIIENGETDIILTPENDFDKGVLEKIHKNKQNFSINTEVKAEYDYGNYKNHRLILNIKEIK